MYIKKPLFKIFKNDKILLMQVLPFNDFQPYGRKF